MRYKFNKTLIIFLILPLVIFGLISLCGIKSIHSAAAETPVLSVKGDSHQGCILFVSVEKISKDVSADCKWMGKEYKMTPTKSGLGVILPVPLDAKPGAQIISIIFKTSQDSIPAINKSIKIKKMSRGVQHLWLPKNQLNKYSDPQADKDDADVYSALSEDVSGISWKENFAMPCRGGITTGFGLKRYYNNDPEPAFHKGLDIAAGYGVPVIASQNGIVRFAKRNLILHGTCCVINHGNGISTLYLHMSSLKVKKGEEVKKGQIIGAVGSSGAASGPHLHWAAYAHGVAISPYILLSLPGEWKE